MIIGSLKEHIPEETRIALTPEVVKKLTLKGHHILLEKDYGIELGYTDTLYLNTGAKIMENTNRVLGTCDIIIQINPPQISPHQLKKCKLIIADFTDSSATFAPVKEMHLEQVPRTSVAQSIDILSAQSLPRGYMASLYTLWHTKRIAPQMITSAATTNAMLALVIGAGTTGLQAAATLKKAGCRITITDINPQTAELAASVGAEFALQTDKEDLHNLILNKNIIINTAPITTPIINTEDMQNLMPFTVFADTTAQPVPQNIPPHINFYSNPHFERFAPLTASDLWANNILNLINIILPTPNSLDLSADYIKAMLIP